MQFLPNRRQWFAAALAFLLLAPAVATAADSPPLTLLPLRDLHLEGGVSVAATGADGKRLYAGTRYSYRVDRRNLVVVTLDAAGKPVGESRRYEDGTAALPENTHATVTGLVVDESRRKLYLTRSYSSAQPVNVSKLLTVWELDASGEPTGNPRSYECGNPHRQLQAIALHPKLPVLYLVGQGGTGVFVYKLDAQGWPEGEPKSFPFGGQGKHEVAVAADGKRLYCGTYPDLLEVLDLDAQGMPAGKPRTFKAGAVKQYLHFQLGPKALYLQRPTAEGPRLAVWPLDESGNPVGEPKVRAALPVSAFTLDPSRTRVRIARDATFADAFTKKPVVSGVDVVGLALDRDAMPSGKEQRQGEADGQAAAIFATGPARTVLLTESRRAAVGNRVRGERLRVTVLDAKLAGFRAPETLTVSFNPNAAGGKPVKVGTLAPGKPPEWIDLDPHLKDRRGQLPAVVSVAGPVVRLRLRIEIANGDPERGGKVVKTWTDEVEGESVLFLLPGYAFEPAAQRAEAFELFSDHAKRYLDAARAGGVKPDERPKQFVVSCYQLMGGQGHRGQLRTQAEMAALLGFNTVNAYSWGRIPPADIDAVLKGHGLKWRSQAVYAPPSYFDYDRDLMNPKALDKWAAPQVAGVRARNGGTPGDVVMHFLADEPGWYYPAQLKAVRDKPERLAAFRDYLRGQKLRPRDLGREKWDDVFPVGASAARDLPSRKLFYWTMRFFAESASRGHRLATEALERAYGHPVLTPVNWNNWADRWYAPSPNQKIANNRDAGPDSAMGSMDWLDAGRRKALTPWSEDWFPDRDAQTWSFYGDLLRSSAGLGARDFGGYVIGGMTGQHPAGARLKTLALVGHGAKAIDYFTWGPEFLFPGNCWSESWRSYRPIADADRSLGRAERLLYPGRPARGTVAIFLPAASALWDADQRPRWYAREIQYLHAALVHAGYTVDFIDDADLAAGALESRGYRALYLTAPNVAAAGAEKLAAWVRAGGTLAVTPGAGVADEYDSPSAALDAVLGVKPRKAERSAQTHVDPLNEHPTGRLTASDEWGGERALFGPVVALEPAGAKVVAKLKNSSPAATVHEYGKGRALAYGFFPGWQYYRTADRSDRARLPRGWDDAARRLAVRPAALANTPRPVILDRTVVEACRLDSAKGIAVVLLNWTDEPIVKLTVTIPAAGAFRKVRSIERGELAATRDGERLTVTLPLGATDVLLIE